MEWTQVATAAQLDGRVAVAGDTMTGNIRWMVPLSVLITLRLYLTTMLTGTSRTQCLASSDGRTIVFPDNTDAPIPGQTGIFVCAGTVAAWTDAGGGTGTPGWWC